MLEWSPILCQLGRFDSDVLVILDACSAGAACDTSVELKQNGYRYVNVRRSYRVRTQELPRILGVRSITRWILSEDSRRLQCLPHPSQLSYLLNVPSEQED